MKVRELIAELQKFDPEMEVCRQDLIDGAMEIHGDLIKIGRKDEAPDTPVVIIY